MEQNDWRGRFTFNTGDTTILLVIMLLFGIVISMQIRVTADKNKQERENDAYIASTFSDAVNEAGWENENLLTTLEQLKGEYEDLLHNLADRNEEFSEQIKILNERLALTRIQACLTDVEGPGIEIRIDDSLISMGGGPNEAIIHKEYIAGLIFVLNHNGAKAISVNGERIVPMSEQNCVVSTIKVNNKSLFPPYVIKAVGDPETLEKAIRASSVYTDKILAYKLREIIKRDDNIMVPKFSGQIESYISLLEEK